jgi:hypothetical protein
MSQIEFDYLGEGRSDDAVARKLIASAAATPGTSYRRPLSGTGKDSLDKRLAGLNAGVQFGKPILVLRDLDHDANCPSELIAQLLPNRHPKLLLRICVREAEAWLMADFQAYAHYCGISDGQIPAAPESLADPKQLLLGWASSGVATRLSRHIQETRKRGVPDWASLGEWHSEFAEKHWDPRRAMATNRSPSLSRAIARIKSIAAGS